MSMPNIPNITPDISVTREDSISLLLASIAINEMSLSHIINAEAEAMQAFVQSDPGNINFRNIIQLNNTTSRLLEEITRGQWLSLSKMDRILRLLSEPGSWLDKTIAEDEMIESEEEEEEE
ncbi:hypothetical protein GC101_22120 [Paenibacillus sp. LMG 31459]|uniref:Uncharacterized protein n=1 Tax=Paenibacillus phytohabitans TaxID=2654978 RepID=A0ABX1YKT9_9BACL|nr:hypothetical protein [Paenibacillus phytohabitans]NOU81562.1 hypothetical protein [Paenibacillus phytohabitans]